MIKYVIRDVLLKLKLSLAYCREQCYDGVSSMPGHKTGIAKTIERTFSTRVIPLTAMEIH